MRASAADSCAAAVRRRRDGSLQPFQQQRKTALLCVDPREVEFDVAAIGGKPRPSAIRSPTLASVSPP